MRTVLLYGFVLANLGIVVGYTFLAVAVVPRAAARLRRTKIGGVVFFFTCALTHLELAIHAAFSGGVTLDELLSWHMAVIHLVQVISVWAFVTGLYIENVRWGPWRAAYEPKEGV